jgi:hypothetical protein
MPDFPGADRKKIRKIFKSFFEMLRVIKPEAREAIRLRKNKNKFPELFKIFPEKF